MSGRIINIESAEKDDRIVIQREDGTKLFARVERVETEYEPGYYITSNNITDGDGDRGAVLMEFDGEEWVILGGSLGNSPKQSQQARIEQWRAGYGLTRVKLVVA